MRYILATYFLGLGLCAAAQSAAVEPRIGTAPAQTRTAGLFGKGSEEMGQTLPAVLWPNGMNFWTPQTRDTEHKCVAPYYYNDGYLQGFRNSHWLVGGCTQDFGSFTISAAIDTLGLTPETRATRFTHDQEVSMPYYYAVELPDAGITAEFTATMRAGLLRLVAHRTGKLYVVLNPNSDESQGWLEVDTVGQHFFGGNPVHRIYQGKGQSANFAGYLVAQPSLKPSGWGFIHGDVVTCGSGESDTHLKQQGADDEGRKPIAVFWTFDVQAGDTLMVRSAASFTSPQGAVANLRAEMPTFDFDTTRDSLRALWDRHLGAVEVEGADADHVVQFYSALYRASFMPMTLSDADGKYPAFGSGEVWQMPEGQRYFDGFSLWDTFRALHPLLNLLYPDLNGQMMQSLVVKAQEGGWLPIFPCWNSYTSAMIGDHGLSVLADAYVKGVRSFDVEQAYLYGRQNAFLTPGDSLYQDGRGRRALGAYLRHGYVPMEEEVAYAYHPREQTSRTLEYAYDDFALAQMARGLGEGADADTLLRRSVYWRNVIEPRSGYAAGRHANGRWAISDPFKRAPFITEGAPCHYTWYVPHDPYGLIRHLGGVRRFTAMLDSMFTEGRYWHGNEPCHQVPFMFTYAGKPWLTQKWVRHILDTEYLNGPGGLSGNDDAGQMSAWYVFASLGLYPVCPGTPYYILSSPTFKRAALRVGPEREFVIEAPEASAENIYIQGATLDGEPYPYAWIEHGRITRGGTLHLDMGPEPSPTWGTGRENLPPDTMLY